jgi:hypothetical protein
VDREGAKGPCQYEGGNEPEMPPDNATYHLIEFQPGSPLGRLSTQPS